ncbi:hypothetical protein ILUMI_08011 [Ignelater luminosus]|uniref:Sodium/potassium-transporting ATPase subunit alpha n=1 Tax=Ignelater luminosus TaxID=2038154 RepID=A0A8K0GB27_IGNLU|nr:hypothetical protein ILUMI_08011 [Ignelater luminosus]
MMRKSSIIRTSSEAGTSVTYIKTLVKTRTPTELDQFKKEISIDDHIISLKKLQERYNTDLQDGLSRVKAGELLRLYGPNCLISSATKSRWLVLAEFLFGGFAALLWVGAALSTIGYLVSYYQDPRTPLDQLYLAGVLVAVILITGIFGYYQEAANTSIMESFKKLVPKFATVIREGNMLTIPAEELVIGDVVEIQGGDCVPADIRIIKSRSLKVDNSSITGESEMQPRSPECTDTNPLETQNLAFYSTNVIEGAGTGVVIATGDNTLIGHIAGLTSGIEPEEMPIKKELKYFIKLITALAIFIGATFFVISIALGYDFFESFIFLIAIIVANVPEGLLVTLTACLTLTARRMSKKNCLVKNLQAIETLGSTSVICSDKTGTLTQNRMTVSHMFYNDTIVDVLDESDKVNRNAEFKNLCRVGILCNRAEFKPEQEKIPILQREVKGDASESAVLKCMEILIGDVMTQRNQMTKICEIPFNSTNKYQVSIHHLQNENKHLLVMKGAPERIIDRCTTYALNGSDVNISSEKKKALQQAVSKLGYMGERVLGFADLMLSKDKFPVGFKFNTDKVNFPLEGLRFVGLMSMIDPPRPNVPNAVEKCRSAGIRVIMVTGDHPITAVAIAKKVGILSSESETIYDVAMKKSISVSKVTAEDKARCSARVITGADLREMSQSKLDSILMTFWEIVFARTSPQQKLKIVESLQRLGYIVAVTGDGVNDSPALKKADIGVAMGISGSDVSKEAADMILLDDNFATIVTGIEEGRLIFDNLKKSIFYVLTSNVPEIIPFILFVTINIPQALSVLAILLVDVGTDLWPAISLAYEKPEADIMSRMPRDPQQDKLVNTRLMSLAYCQIGFIQTCAGYVTWFFVMAQHGFFYDRLIGIRKEWDDPFTNDLADSYGQEWTYEERKILERKGYAAYFLAIVVTQICDAFIVKTRRLSVVQQGMSNWVLNTGILFVIFVAGVILYSPGVNQAMQFERVEWYTFVPSLPFGLFIIIYDEYRRYFVRNYPNGWFARETYY